MVAVMVVLVVVALLARLVVVGIVLVVVELLTLVVLVGGHIIVMLAANMHKQDIDQSYTSWLIYSDYLEENRELNLAEQIRFELDYKPLDCPPHYVVGGGVGGGNDIGGYISGYVGGGSASVGASGYVGSYVGYSGGSISYE